MAIVNPLSSRTLIFFSAAALVVCSIPVFFATFPNDMEFYSLFANKLLSGRELYRDAMDTKPPLVFLHYALVFKVFGSNNVTALKMVTMGWLGLTAMAIVALRRALSPGAAMPVLAAPFFILSSFSGWGEDFLSSNTELLANLFIVVGVWVLASRKFTSSPPHLLVGGSCIGIAFLYRYQSGAALAAYVTTILLRHREFDRKIVRLLLVGAGFALPSVVFVAYYARIHALADLRLMLALQSHYVRDAGAFDLPALLGQTLLALSGLWPIVYLAAVQAISIGRKGATMSRGDVFMVTFAVWSVATFFVGGRLFPHYFVQSLPSLVLLATERLDPGRRDLGLASTARGPWFEKHSLSVMTAIAVVFASINGTYYWTWRDKPSRDLVAFVEAHSRPSEEVLLWAWRPYVLLESRRQFATRLLGNSFLIGQLAPAPRTPGPRVRRSGLLSLWPAFLHDLAASPPRIIIDDPPGQSEWSMDRYPQFAPLLADYHPCQVMDEACVYLRRN